MSNYKRGRAFEYRVKNFLEDLGFIVVRAAGSHSPFDIVAYRKDRIVFVQCKLGKFNKKELDLFKALALECRIKVVRFLFAHSGRQRWNFFCPKQDKWLDKKEVEEVLR